jgi:hypothetical protein
VIPRDSAQAKKYLLSDDPGDPPVGASEIYYNTQQMYDSFMMFAYAADAMLQQEPSLSSGSIRGPRLYDALLKTRLAASQGKIVLDGYGLKDGHFLMRNVWGKQKIKVLLLDSWAKKVFDIANPDLMVTDLSGKVTWKFQGDPIVFMGNTSTSPPNVVLGNCAAGTYFVPSTNPAETGCKDCPAGYYIERNTAAGYSRPHAAVGHTCLACGCHGTERCLLQRPR